LTLSGGYHKRAPFVRLREYSDVATIRASGV
jgi:hypothetical protein